MKIQVRYYQDKVDILFIGGALYAYGLDNKLKEYIANLDANKVSKAIFFQHHGYQNILSI